MIDKGQIAELNSKWDSLLIGLGKDKNKLYKYSRIFEKIVASNDEQNVKILLAIARRVFFKSEKITSTKSKKNRHLVMEFKEEELYMGYNIDMESAVTFVEAASDIVVDELGKVEKISHLEIEDNSIYIIF